MVSPALLHVMQDTRVKAWTAILLLLLLPLWFAAVLTPLSRVCSFWISWTQSYDRELKIYNTLYKLPSVFKKNYFLSTKMFQSTAI
jgi:hypothetical protein